MCEVTLEYSGLMIHLVQHLVVHVLILSITLHAG